MDGPELLTHKTIAIAGLLAAGALVIALSSAQVTSQDATAQAASQYNLSVNTDTPNVRETEADFKANLTQLDSEFDGALIYWNYSADSSLSNMGPVTFTNSTGSVEMLQAGLTPGTSYDYEAYAEPVVWSDENLTDNVIKRIEQASRSNVIENNTGSIIAGSGASSLWFNENFSKRLWESFDPAPPQDPHPVTNDGSTYLRLEDGGYWLEFEKNGLSEESDGFVNHSIEIDFTNVDSLNVETKANGDSLETWYEMRIEAGSQTLFTQDYGTHSWTNRTFDVSSISGKKDLRLGTYIVSGSAVESGAGFRNIYLE